MAFTLAKLPSDLVFRRAALAARTEVTDGYLVLRFAGDELRGFSSPGADDHVRVFFPPTRGLSASMSAADLREFPSREYTPLAWDPEAGVLELAFVVHAEDGVGARWARHAPIGSLVGVGGPRGSTVLQGRPDSWFLAGDETAAPAITRFLAAAGPDAVGLALIEVPDPGREIPLAAPAGIVVEYLHRKDRPAGEALIDRIGQLGPSDRPAGDVLAFIAAERGVVKPGRALVRDRWSIDLDRAIVKGYWARGATGYHAPH